MPGCSTGIAKPRQSPLVEPSVAATIVPAATGKSFVARAGQHIAVAQRDGGQVVDLFVFTYPEADEYLSAQHTRVSSGRLFPRAGEPFLSNRRTPIVTLIADSSPGVHDMLIAACDPMRYQLLGASAHPNCEQNLATAMREAGVELRVVPQPVNLFMNVPVRPDGSLELAPSPAGPGDRVVLRAERDVLVVVSSCPQDMLPINNGAPKDVDVAIYDP